MQGRRVRRNLWRNVVRGMALADEIPREAVRDARVDQGSRKGTSGNGSGSSTIAATGSLFEHPIHFCRRYPHRDLTTTSPGRTSQEAFSRETVYLTRPVTSVGCLYRTFAKKFHFCPRRDLCSLGQVLDQFPSA